MTVSHPVTEVIFVGLPGPTHHYSGLSPDNVASGLNRGTVSNPKQAALQALDLVRLLQSLGVAVAMLPPQLRPNMPLLRQHFSGDDDSVIKQAALHSPALLEKSCSAAAMWTANAATVAPVSDTSDHHLHITAANLFTNLHRRIEAEDTYRVLKAIFQNVPDCIIHPPLSAAAGMRDEGAANHMRLAPSHADAGLNIFIYGADGSSRDPESARQTLSASRALATQHHIPQALFIRQNPEVITQGVFHNDVIAVSNENLLLSHELAFEGGAYDVRDMADAYAALHAGKKLNIITIADEELSVEEAVHSYFFNSQIVTKPDGKMALIAPLEVQLLYEGRGLALMERICADPSNPIDEVHMVDLRQSMRNGGGPACLRLRMVLTEVQLAAVKADTNVVADEALLAALENIIRAHYPDQLTSEDLGNPALYHMSRAVLEQLSDVMTLPLL